MPPGFGDRTHAADGLIPLSDARLYSYRTDIDENGACELTKVNDHSVFDGADNCSLIKSLDQAAVCCL